MIQDLQPHTYVMLFIFFGLALVGLEVLCLAVYIGVMHKLAPKPPVLDERRWTKDWATMDRED